MGDQLRVYDRKMTSQLADAPNVAGLLGQDHSMTLMCWVVDSTFFMFNGDLGG